MEHEKKQIQPIENVPVDLAFEAMLKQHLRQIKKDEVLEEIIRRRYYIKKSALIRLAKKNRNQ